MANSTISESNYPLELQMRSLAPFIFKQTTGVMFVLLIRSTFPRRNYFSATSAYMYIMHGPPILIRSVSGNCAKIKRVLNRHIRSKLCSCVRREPGCTCGKENINFHCLAYIYTTLPLTFFNQFLNCKQTVRQYMDLSTHESKKSDQ